VLIHAVGGMTSTVCYWRTHDVELN